MNVQIKLIFLSMTVNFVISMRNMNCLDKNKALQPDKKEIEELNQFNDFKLKFKKSYSKIDEDAKYANFKKNQETSSLLNTQAKKANPKSQVKFGVTPFSDMSECEFSKTYLTLNAKNLPKDKGGINKLLEKKKNENKLKKVPNTSVAASPTTTKSSSINISNLSSTPDYIFDWRKRGIITPVKNQLKCGSCWIFGALGAIESLYNYKYSTFEILSEQQAMDCINNTNPCVGGEISDLLDYAIYNGFDDGYYYPYTGIRGKCKYSDFSVTGKINTYVHETDLSEIIMKEALEVIGPFVAMINANPLQNYVSGILDLPYEYCDPNKLNHSVLIVGYGISNGQEYWIIKNSWSDLFGEDGYLRLALGKGTCGINKHLFFVDVN